MSACFCPGLPVICWSVCCARNPKHISHCTSCRQRFPCQGSRVGPRSTALTVRNLVRIASKRENPRRFARHSCRYKTLPNSHLFQLPATSRPCLRIHELKISRTMPHESMKASACDSMRIPMHSSVVRGRRHLAFERTDGRLDATGSSNGKSLKGYPVLQHPEKHRATRPTPKIEATFRCR